MSCRMSADKEIGRRIRDRWFSISTSTTEYLKYRTVLKSTTVAYGEFAWSVRNDDITNKGGKGFGEWAPGFPSEIGVFWLENGNYTNYRVYPHNKATVYRDGCNKGKQTWQMVMFCFVLLKLSKKRANSENASATIWWKLSTAALQSTRKCFRFAASYCVLG